MQTWQMQTAKARFSDVVRSAKVNRHYWKPTSDCRKINKIAKSKNRFPIKSNGPQDFTVHGKSVAVVVSRDLFDRLSGNTQSLVEFMQHSPLYGMDDLVFDRNPSLTHEVNL